MVQSSRNPHQDDFQGQAMNFLQILWDDSFCKAGKQ